MFTMVGFYDAAAHAALAAIPAIADPHIRVSVNDIYIPAWNKILAVFAGGADLEQLRLQSPSLRRMANQKVEPVLGVVLPDGRDLVNYVHDYHLNPRTLDIAEALNAYCLNAVGGGAEYVFVWLMDKLEPLPAGEIFTIEGTTNATGVLGKWVNDAVTFTQTLPAGRYALVGMRVGSNSGDAVVVAARCVFPDVSPRPGVIASHSQWTATVPLFRQGFLGSWGEFEHDAPPTLDSLCTADSAAAYPICFDLIQVRAGRR